MLNDNDLNNYLKKSFENLKVPGGTAVLIDGDNTKYYYYGENEKGLINADTQFLIGSFSESITAMGILKLIDEGKITEHTKIIDVLPDFADRNPYTSGITITQLLSHTSGISKSAGYSYTNLNLTGPDSIKQALDKISRLQVGTNDFDDSNLNYLILGRIIETVSGKNYADFMKETIFTPLNMTRTTASKEIAAEQGMAKGFRSALGIIYRSMLLYDDAGAPYGYIASTPSDLEKYIRYILDKKGEPVLSNVIKSNLELPLYTKDFRNNYGLGFNMINPGTDEAELISNGLMGDYNSQILIMPKKKQAIILLVNKGHALQSSSLETLRDNLKKAFNGDVPLDIRPHIPYIEFGTLLTAVIGAIWLFIRILRRKKYHEFALIDYVLAVLQIAGGIALFPLISYILGYPLKIMGALAPDVTVALLVIALLLILHGLFTFYKIFFIDRNRRLFPKIPYRKKDKKNRKKKDSPDQLALPSSDSETDSTVVEETTIETTVNNPELVSESSENDLNEDRSDDIVRVIDTTGEHDIPSSEPQDNITEEEYVYIAPVQSSVIITTSENPLIMEESPSDTDKEDETETPEIISDTKEAEPAVQTSEVVETQVDSGINDVEPASKITENPEEMSDNSKTAEEILISTEETEEKDDTDETESEFYCILPDYYQEKRFKEDELKKDIYRYSKSDDGIEIPLSEDEQEKLEKIKEKLSQEEPE